MGVVPDLRLISKIKVSKQGLNSKQNSKQDIMDVTVISQEVFPSGFMLVVQVDKLRKASVYEFYEPCATVDHFLVQEEDKWLGL